MGIDLEELQKLAQEFKEQVWYYLECNKHKVAEDSKIYVTGKVNTLLDMIDELED